MKQYALDENARLEFGFRIKSTQASYRELESLLGKDAKVNWARTKTRPDPTKHFAIPAEIDQNGTVDIPHHVIDVFTRYGGHMMVKLVTPLPIGRYANLAMVTDDRKGKLWDFDKTQAKRDNGDYVYSMPLHGLDKAGEGLRFFFVIRLNRQADGNIVLAVDKMTVTRGKEHFTVVRKSHGPFPAASAENIPLIADRFTSIEGGKETHPLRGLPLAEAISRSI
ncbi:MAG: hypothetical protein WDN47_03705 [Candidatus Doudnabacteria bacterium]